jgi:hypothetical protein
MIANVPEEHVASIFSVNTYPAPTRYKNSVTTIHKIKLNQYENIYFKKHDIPTLCRYELGYKFGVKFGSCPDSKTAISHCTHTSMAQHGITRIISIHICIYIWSSVLTETMSERKCLLGCTNAYSKANAALMSGKNKRFATILTRLRK